MKRPIRLALLGMIPGNGHPYSWSAIVNGYDPVEMAKCPYTMIPEYLDKQPTGTVGIEGAQITHIWTDDADDAPRVAAAARIPNVVSRPEDVIGDVDAVIIATDDGADHARRVRSFVEAKVPVFVDKPLASTREELHQFVDWKKDGARILSSSGMRYAPELEALRHQNWLWLTSITCKSWERYGIHALEPIYTLLGEGFTEVRSESQPGSDIIYCRHRSGGQATISAIHEAYGSIGVIHGYGRDNEVCVRVKNTYLAFRNQLTAVVEWVRSGHDPYPFSDTVELMAIVIAAQESRQRGGELLQLNPILEEFKL